MNTLNATMKNTGTNPDLSFFKIFKEKDRRKARKMASNIHDRKHLNQYESLMELDLIRF